MKLFGFEITRKRAPQNLQNVNYYNGYGPWFGPVLESFSGAWQMNVTVAPTQTLLSFPPVFCAITGIASDIAKIRIKLSRNVEGIWTEITENQPWLPLLRNPNRYQDHVKFFQSWMLSKLLYGNTYALKQRDQRGVVDALFVLHPQCVKPLVSDDGAVYYEIDQDYLSQVDERVIVPQSEMIHDRFNCLWHPLIGVSPLYAAGMAGTLGNAIQSNSATFFANQAMPGGVLTAPGNIADETAARLKAAFESKFSGANRGRLFVAGDGLTFEPFTMQMDHAQTVEQLKQAREDVACVFHYPLWKMGGPMPPYTKPDLAQTSYYTDCLQSHIVDIEKCLDNGLELPLGMGTEFDLDELMRMDINALYESNNTAKNWMKLDEKRFRANLPPLPVGGDTVYLQEQDHSVEAISERDESDNPFGTAKAAPTALEPAKEPAQLNPAPEPRSIEFTEEEMRALYEAEMRRDLIHA